MLGQLWDQNGGGRNYNLALTNNFGATTNPGVSNDISEGYEVGSTWINTSTDSAYLCSDSTEGAAVWLLTGNTASGLVVAGVAAGYKLARGVHTQVAASDTIVTGLATVVAALATFQSAPTIKQLSVTADIGNQTGAPAAGSILVKTFKPTAVNDVTPIPATDFTDNIKFGWIAVGT